MTDEEALKEIDRQEKRFAAAGFGNGLRLAKSARGLEKGQEPVNMSE